MSDGTLILLAIAGVLALLAARRRDGSARQGAVMAIERFIEILPRILFALLAAGFIGRLIPGQAMGRLLGPESGFLGIMIASALGGFVPSGPMVSFPVVVVFTQAGAGFPQVCAFVTAWSVLALHRVLIFELALMGWHFSLTRIISSLILPPLCGLLAQFLFWVHPIKWPPW
jgi:uncharacterized membrane protein YraQ (UPF0718 family)